MIKSNFLNDPLSVLVADTSAVINLNATEYISEILAALPHRVAVVENVCTELEQGAEKGYKDLDKLLELIKRRLVDRLPLTDESMTAYESLVDRDAEQTLHDGEAATIVLAFERGGIAVLDDHKARKVCAKTFPSVEFVSTAELLVHDLVKDALDYDKQADAIFNALSKGRMRIFPDQWQAVRKLIGKERASVCLSLPPHLRG